MSSKTTTFRFIKPMRIGKPVMISVDDFSQPHWMKAILISIINETRTIQASNKHTYTLAHRSWYIY